MPNTHEQAFLSAIRENPNDDAPRLVYADWLDEHGNAARAEFIRVQCRLGGLDEDDPQSSDLRRREYELLADHWGEWAGPLIGRVRRWRFRRGFIDQVKLEAGQFLKEGRWLLDFAPVEELDVRHPNVEDLRALLASRHIRRIARLNLDFAEVGNAGLALLAQSPNLAGLAHLSLRFNNVGVEGLLALAEAPHLTSLRSLDVTANDLPRSAFGEFLAACRLPLEGLSWDDAIGPEGIRDLSASPLAGRLKELHFRDAHLGPKGLRLLARSSAFARLEELRIERDTIGSAGARALAGSPLLRRLAALELSCGQLDDDGAEALACLAQAPALRGLDLSFNRIGPRGAKALVSLAVKLALN
jgi:uncharacterized protein (TIGR02996 family)